MYESCVQMMKSKIKTCKRRKQIWECFKKQRNNSTDFGDLQEM